MVKTSIIMTVFDREPAVILNTLRWLAMSDLSETEVVVVDDNSTIPTSYLEPLLPDINGRLIRLEPYACYEIRGFNNPARAFNVGLEAAQGERLVILSSDVLVPPRVLAKAAKFSSEETVFCPMVIDLSTGHEYCGPNRVFPMPWFLSTSTKQARDCGGWDENYLLGMCYEDNDFVGRLALQVGSITFDWNQIVWHQSHYQPAYSNEPWIQVANQRNKMYTADKWHGIPFDDALGQVWDIARGRHENGDLQLRFTDSKNLMQWFRSVKDAVATSCDK